MGDADVLKDLEEDGVFREFLAAEFDPKAYATTVIQSMAITQQLAKLADGISSLDKEIQSQVVAHHEDLLSQATGIETLEGVLEMMQTRIQSLLAAIARIQSKVVQPYEKIVTRTAQLQRLQETCDLLRRIIRILYLSKRLHTQLQGGTREITKAAQSLNELNYLSEGVDLSGVDILEQDRRFVKQARKEVENQAQSMLEQGMETQNQTQVATSLQVFYNLGSLDYTVNKVLDDCNQRVHEAIASSLNVATVSHLPSMTSRGSSAKLSAPGPANTATFRATLWTNMEKLMDTIYSTCSQVQHLQKVLIKKRDPVTHVCFIEELTKAKDNQNYLVEMFWTNVTSTITHQFQTAAEANTFVKQAFEGEYPKLLRLFNDLWKRMLHFSSEVIVPQGPMNNESSTAEPFQPEKELRNCLSAFENAYLSRSLSRLFDPINLVFAVGSLNAPTEDEVVSITKTIASELQVAGVDNDLSVSVARNVSKTVQFYVVKSEQLLCTGGEASQVINNPTTGQDRNVAVVNALFQLHQEVSKVILGLTIFPQEGIEAMQSSLQAVVVQMGNALQPLFSSISDSLEAIILTMHQEDFSSQVVIEGQEAQCSLYMREMNEFILKSSSLYLSDFVCRDFIMDSIQPIASRCLDLFVRHIAIIRPLGEGGKMRLAADCAQMEMAIAPLCRRVGDLGKAYRLLRAFRPLLFQTNEHVASSLALGEIIPYSLALQFLFARAPADLKSPHQAAGWSISRYTQWWDDHPLEKDRLAFIKGTVESYVQSVTTRGGKEFAPVYPIMLDILQRGLQHHSAGSL